MQKLFSVAILTLCITILLVYSCDKDKEKSIVGPVEDTYTISGKVVTDRAYSFRNLTVTLIGTSVEDTTITDKWGTYSFDGLPAGKYIITPSKEGYEFFLSSAEASITGTNVNIDDFIGWYDRENVENGDIIGKIVDTDNKPVWGVNVQVFPYPQKTDKTSEYGYYYIHNTLILNAPYQIVPVKEGYNYTFSPDTSYVTPTEQVTVVHFTASYSGSPLHSISGRIVDAGGNGVFSSIWLVREKGLGESYHSKTDKDGFYTFCDLKDGTYILRVLANIAQETIIVDGKDVIMPEIECEWCNCEAEDYFPLKTGSSWIYDRTINDGRTFDYTVSVTDTISHNGTTYSQMSIDFPGDFNTYRIGHNTVYALSEGEEKLFLQFGIYSGDEWIIDYIQDYTCKGTFLGAESIEVPAGTYTGCLHIETIITYGSTTHESLNMWFARDIGLVKAMKVIVSYGKLIETITDELKECDVVSN